MNSRSIGCRCTWSVSDGHAHISSRCPTHHGLWVKRRDYGCTHDPAQNCTGGLSTSLLAEGLPTGVTHHTYVYSTTSEALNKPFWRAKCRSCLFYYSGYVWGRVLKAAVSHNVTEMEMKCSVSRDGVRNQGSHTPARKALPKT